jgi:hypothetical protein
MKRILFVTLFAMLLAVPATFAQNSSSDYNHGYVGGFFDYFRLNHASQNFYGVGGRVGFNVASHVALEADGAYDWKQNLNGVGAVPGFNGVDFTGSNLRLVHASFGPKFQFGSSGPIRAFVFAKGGILNYNFNTTTSGTFSGIVHGDTNGVFMPGGGIEAYAGWFGIRADIADEMVFSDGTHQNLRITIGPHIRF